MEKRKVVARDEATTKLKAVRLRRGLTQKEVIEKTGINAGTYKMYEQGGKKFDNARIDTILRTCIVLNCDIGEILENPEYIEIYNEYINA